MCGVCGAYVCLCACVCVCVRARVIPRIILKHSKNARTSKTTPRTTKDLQGPPLRGTLQTFQGPSTTFQASRSTHWQLQGHQARPRTPQDLPRSRAGLPFSCRWATSQWGPSECAERFTSICGCQPKSVSAEADENPNPFIIMVAATDPWLGGQRHWTTLS